MFDVGILQADVSSVPILVAIALIILIGYIGRAIFNRTRIPEALILIAIGLLLVPIGHLLSGNYVNELRSLAAIFGDLALVVIMFNGGKIIGIERKLFQNTIGIALGILDTIVPMVVLTFLMWFLFGWPLIYGAILGAILGETASVIIIPVIKKLKIPSDIYNALVMETTLNSVIAILSFTLLLSFANGHGITAGSFANFTIDYLSVAVAFGLIVGVLWIVLQNYVKGAREYLATLAMAILLYGVVILFSGAGVISVLIFAIMLGNYKPIVRFFGFRRVDNKKSVGERLAVEHDIEFLLMTFFFVFIGMIAVLSTQYLLYAIIITVVLMLIRAFEVWPVLRKKYTAFRGLAYALMQRGTVVAVLAAIVFSIGGHYFNQIFYICFMVIILTNITGSVLMSKIKFAVKEVK